MDSSAAAAIAHLQEVGTSTEERALEAWQQAHLPLPIPQYKVIINGKDAYLDFAYPEQKISIECDGYITHDVLRAAEDRNRDRWLTVHGWIILRFPNSSSDYEFISDVRSALSLRTSAA